MTTAYKHELEEMKSLTDRYTVAIGLVFNHEYFDTFPELRQKLLKADSLSDQTVKELKEYLTK